MQDEPTGSAAVAPGADVMRPGTQGSGTTIAAILISVFLMGAGMGVLGSAVSLRAGLEGFSNSLVGLIMSANYAGLIIGSMVAPILIRNVGYVRAFAASAALGSASAISHVLLIDPIAWIVFRTATGFALSVMFVVAESWLNSSSTRTNRGRLLSAYSVVYLVSMGAGQPLLGLFSPAGFEIFGATTMLISLCLIPVAIMRVTGEPVLDRQPPRLIRTFMRSPLAGSGVIVAGLMAGATWSLTPLYGQQVGLEGGAIGILMLLVSVGTMVLQWPLGWISDTKNRRLAILWSIGTSAGAAMLIAMIVPSGGLLYVLIFLYGGFGMPLYSLSVALANDQFEPHEMVRAAGAIVIYYGIGNVLGPVLGSQFMRWIGPGGLFLFVTLVLALFLGFVLIRITLIPALPKRTSRFRLYPRTSASAFQMLRKARPRRKPASAPHDQAGDPSP
ncbi:MAG: MFS transporter [Alkalispirochaeta sp.]